MNRIAMYSAWLRAARSTLLLLIAGASQDADAAALKTRNVVLITADGLRWQDVFRGAEELLLNKQNGGVRDTNALRREFWRATAEERRRALLPFLWDTIARRGQLLGNQDKGSRVRVTNGKNFSYPGYNEILTGSADSRINSNDKKPNPNTNVLEWLHGQPAFRGKVAAFGSWDAFPFILNRGRAGFPVQAGWEIVDQPNTKSDAANRILRDAPRTWDDVIYDSFMFETALDHIRQHKPRVVYVAFGETDDWAHDGRYDLSLRAAHHFDRSIQLLWEMLQAMPDYQGQTTFLIATDHGRGTGPTEWKDHGEKIPESAFIWIAAFGPDTPARGERGNLPDLTQGQIATTVAALLGQDFRSAVPNAAPAISELLP